MYVSQKILEKQLLYISNLLIIKYNEMIYALQFARFLSFQLNKKQIFSLIIY